MRLSKGLFGIFVFNLWLLAFVVNLCAAANSSLSVVLRIGGYHVEHEVVGTAVLFEDAASVAESSSPQTKLILLKRKPIGKEVFVCQKAAKLFDTIKKDSALKYSLVACCVE